MTSKTTETLDKLYLEWSQFTGAKTARELKLEKQKQELLRSMKPFAELVTSTNGRIPTERLSLADWHALIKAWRNNHD